MNLAGKILVCGENGQVGRALQALLGEKAVVLGSRVADFSNPDAVRKVLDNIATPPNAIINAAAYTQVDKAEEEEEVAFCVNAETPGLLAEYAAKHTIPFVHYSTDYVFPGMGSMPLKETDDTAPQNAYGRTKLAGEENIQAVGGKFLIFRTSWVYDETGKNFLTTMLRLGKERETLRVVADQLGAPTYAPALAEATLAALDYAENQLHFPSGVYHLAGQGVASWHGFAEAIFAEARQRGIKLAVENVEPIPSSAYPTPAKRPENSQLDCSLAQTVLHASLPDWWESLKCCMERVIA